MSGFIISKWLRGDKKPSLVIIIVKYILQSTLKSRTVLFNYIPGA